MFPKIHTVDLKTSTFFMFHEEQQPLFIPILERFAPYNTRKGYISFPLFSLHGYYGFFFNLNCWFLDLLKIFTGGAFFFAWFWLYVLFNVSFSILNYHLLLRVNFWLFFNLCVNVTCWICLQQCELLFIRSFKNIRKTKCVAFFSSLLCFLSWSFPLILEQLENIRFHVLSLLSSIVVIYLYYFSSFFFNLIVPWTFYCIISL